MKDVIFKLFSIMCGRLNELIISETHAVFYIYSIFYSKKSIDFIYHVRRVYGAARCLQAGCTAPRTRRLKCKPTFIARCNFLHFIDTIRKKYIHVCDESSHRYMLTNLNILLISAKYYSQIFLSWHLGRSRNVVKSNCNYK